MTELREKLAGVICADRAVDNWQAMPWDYDLADTIIAALPDMVLPLEWECTDWSAGDGVKGENDCEWTAEVWPMTSYIISWFGGERFEVNTPLDEKLDANSLAAAKNTAQAHFAAQSVSAFGVQGGEA